MTDYFALLGESRRPWIDPDALKNKFLSLSTQYHPDRVHEQGGQARQDANHKYAELNAAYQCLSHTKERLLHLITLESGASPRDIQRIPPGTMEYFMEVAQLCKQLDLFLTERKNVTSPLLKVRLFEQGLDWAEKVSALRKVLTGFSSRLEDELKSLNHVWDEQAGPSPARSQTLPLERLEQIYRTMSFLSRWDSHLQEKSVLLTI
jgi:curved DNA-binding protein CbpA